MKKLLLIFLLLIIANPVYSQTDKSIYYSYGTQFYTEHIFYISDSADSLTVNILYRIMYDALSFTKEINNLSQFVYNASPKIEVTFKDSDGIIRNRAFTSDSIALLDYEETNSKDLFLKNVISTKLPIDNYEAKLSIYENKSLIYDTKFTIFGDSLNNIEYFSKPIFCYKTDENDKSDNFNLLILDNNFIFNQANSYALILNYADTNEDLDFSISKDSDSKDTYWSNEINFTGRANKMLGKSISINGNELALINSTIENDKLAVFQIKLPSSELTPGKYTLKVNSSKGIERSMSFSVNWLNMPLSLENSDYAVDLMYYILTDEEFKAMNKGDKSEKIHKVSEYWRLLDPTPETFYNEAMIEYFTRVDFAYFNYQTIKDKDGAKTQRGKIYILYGKPDEVQNELISNNAREIWIYSKIKKQFIFENTSPGIYELTQVNDL